MRKTDLNSQDSLRCSQKLDELITSYQRDFCVSHEKSSKNEVKY
ncbi:aspartyl-phosphate phosphatase Spo0E family protein [Cytobacillus sp. Hz8]